MKNRRSRNYPLNSILSHTSGSKPLQTQTCSSTPSDCVSRPTLINPIYRLSLIGSVTCVPPANTCRLIHAKTRQKAKSISVVRANTKITTTAAPICRLSTIVQWCPLGGAVAPAYDWRFNSSLADAFNCCLRRLFVVDFPEQCNNRRRSWCIRRITELWIKSEVNEVLFFRRLQATERVYVRHSRALRDKMAEQKP